MNSDMLKILLQQFGIDPAQADQFFRMVGEAGAKIEGFDARLTEISNSLARIERELSGRGSDNAKH